MSRELGIEVLTLYAFSTENWMRPKAEVGSLMDLLYDYLERELSELNNNDIRLRTIGETGRLPSRVRSKLIEVMEATRDNTSMILNLALSYGGRQELVAAFRALARSCMEGSLTPEDIDEDTISDHLYTSGLPDPDLIVRTSGEYRLSNFLLFQAAYAEIYITDTLWPDFGREQFLEALADYAKRQRRFGRTEEQVD